MLRRLAEIFFSIPAPIATAVVFLLTAGESALFLGLLIPGELIVILAGVLASRVKASLPGILLAGVIGPIVGDSIGYYLGRRYGRRFFDGKRRKRWARARNWLRKKGAFAVFLGRFTAFLRSVIPGAAGVARMPYRKFLPWNLAAGVIWGAGSALLGYFGGRNYETLAARAGYIGIALFLILTAAGAYYLLRRRARRLLRTRRRGFKAFQARSGA